MAHLHDSLGIRTAEGRANPEGRERLDGARIPKGAKSQTARKSQMARESQTAPGAKFLTTRMASRARLRGLLQPYMIPLSIFPITTYWLRNGQ